MEGLTTGEKEATKFMAVLSLEETVIDIKSVYETLSILMRGIESAEDHEIKSAIRVTCSALLVIGKDLSDAHKILSSKEKS